MFNNMDTLKQAILQMKNKHIIIKLFTNMNK